MIGHYSCLAVADVANITSYYNNTKTSYLMYKNGTGINIDEVGKETGEFRNGLEVSVEVNVDIYSDLTSTIKKLAFFDMLHIKYIDENAIYPIREVEDRCNSNKSPRLKHFGISKFLDGKKGFKVGNVIYKDDHDYLKDICDNVYIDLPLGEVDITPSREALQYTDRTINTIIHAVAAARQEIKEYLHNYVKRDFTLKEFVNTFCMQFYNISVEDCTLKISKDTVSVDLENSTINDKTIPSKFLETMQWIKYVTLDKSYISKIINDNNYTVTLLRIATEEAFLVEKLNKTIKQSTYDYFREIYTDKMIILKYDNLQYIEGLLKSKFIHESDKDLYDEAIDFFFSNLEIRQISNELVPKEWLDANVIKEPKKKKEFTETQIRSYHKYGYNYCNPKYLNKKGLIIYTAHTNKDENLRALADIFYGNKSIGGVISVKKEDLPFFKNSKRYIYLDEFLLKKNNILVKLITAEMIIENFRNLSLKYNIEKFSLPIWRKFLSEYGSYANIESFNCQFFRDLRDYYVSQGWVNKHDIDYYKLSDKEIETIVAWNKMKIWKSEIIRNFAVKKFGNMPKIGLTPHIFRKNYEHI